MTDAFDLTAAQIVNAPDVKNWPATTALTKVWFDGAVSRFSFTKQDGPDRWPDVRPAGSVGPNSVLERSNIVLVPASDNATFVFPTEGEPDVPVTPVPTPIPGTIDDKLDEILRILKTPQVGTWKTEL